MRLLEAVETVNDMRKRAMARKVSTAFAGVLRGKTVAVLGLTFKPNTDDMRDAPSIPPSGTSRHGRQRPRLRSHGNGASKAAASQRYLLRGLYDCIEDADAAVIVAQWEQFRALDLERVRGLMACPLIINLRNIYSPEGMRKQGSPTAASEEPQHTCGERLCSFESCSTRGSRCCSN